MINFKKITLYNYRNFARQEIELDKNCNIFYGKNGSGKTNILENISLFGKGRGFRNDKIKNMIKVGKNSFTNIAELEINNNL